MQSEMAFFLNEDRLVPPLKKLAVPLCRLLKSRAYIPVRLAHADGKIAVGSFYQQMAVIAHKTLGRRADPMTAFIHVPAVFRKVVQSWSI
ncbi:MAG: hypothetical protein HGA43_01420 [Nitrospirae bacterium]|nr:hypothetical protein [Nitrospirota bacterium]